MDQPGPKGQWDPPGGPVEACDYSWSPRSNATALAGYVITTIKLFFMFKYGYYMIAYL